MKSDFERCLKSANIELDNDEKNSFQKDMNSVIEWVSSLNSANVDDLKDENESRNDVTQRRKSNDLLRGSMESKILDKNKTKNDYFFVPKVIE